MRLHLAEAYLGDCKQFESLVHLVTVHCTPLQVSTNGDISDVAALLQSRPKPAPPQVCSLMWTVLDSSKSVCCNPIGHYMVANPTFILITTVTCRVHTVQLPVTSLIHLLYP